MSVAFADSSALVKLYADEAHAETVRSLDEVAISQLARVEVPAALFRKQRIGEMSPSDVQVLISAFEADYFGTDQEPGRFVVMILGAAVLEDAARLSGVHGLRAYDAVQLASACAMAKEVPEGMVFAAFDRSLLRAAALEGLRLL